MKTKLILLAILLILAIGASTPLQAKDPTPNVSIAIERVEAIGTWGVVHISDRFIIRYDNGTTPLSSLDFGFPRKLRDNVYYLDAKDKQGLPLSLDTDTNPTSPVFWVKAHFPELTSNKTYEFSVTTILRGVERVPGGFELNITAAPILMQDARVANVTAIASTGSSFVIPPNSSYTQITFSGQPGIFKQFKPWKALSQDTFYVGYRTVSQYLVDLPSVQRDIIVGRTGGLSVKDTYQVHNLGIAFTSLTIVLPEGANNVMAYDLVGAMWAAPQNPPPPYQIAVSPRYSSGGVRGNENFVFTLTYDVPPAKYIKQLNWWGTYNLTFKLLNNKEDFIFTNATVRVITPPGVTVTNTKPATLSTISKAIPYDPANQSFTLRGATDIDDLNVGLTMNYPPFWSGFSYLPWLFGFEIILAAVVIAFKIRRGPELAIPVPVEKLREFVGLYDERLALTRELVVMEEEVARGGLVKHEFRRRRKLMELRLDEINKSLMQVKTEVRALSPRYDELIRRIDRAEGEIEISRNSVGQVRSQYRAGKTTKETYDSMVNDIMKRVDRAEGTVETILITLREDAR